MKKLLFADFLFALLLLMTAEIGVRLFLPQDVAGRFSYGYDQDSGFVEAGDGMVHLVRAGGRRFLPQTFSRQRPADTCRIMVIGDSVPRGSGLKAAYPYRLQELLRSQGIRAEVINLAVAGFGVRRSQLVLRKVLDYEPGLIILHLNDSNEYEDEREYRRSQDFQGWHPRHWLMKVFIFARGYEIKTEKVLWRLLPDKIRLQNAINDADAEVLASLDQAKQDLWQQRVRRTAKETVALAQDKGVPVVLVTQADREAGPAGQDRVVDHDLDALGHSLAGPGVYVLSMKELFADLTPVRAYFADSAHLTAAGHEVLAQALADLVSQKAAGRGQRAESDSRRQ